MPSSSCLLALLQLTDQYTLIDLMIAKSKVHWKDINFLYSIHFQNDWKFFSPAVGSIFDTAQSYHSPK